MIDLFAAVSALRGGDVSMLIGIALVAAGSAGAVAAGLSLMRRDPARRDTADAGRLGAALGLRRRQRHLVVALARSADMPTPAALLISRGCFDHAMRCYVAAHGRARQVAAIRDRVFGDEPMS